MRLFFILVILISSLFAEGKESTVYIKVGWGLDNISSLQASGNATSNTTSSMQNVELGYDYNIVRIAAYIKTGQDIVPSDNVVKIGYRLGITTKKMFNFIFEPVKIVPVFTLNSSYISLQNNSSLSGNALGASLIFDLHFTGYDFVSTYLEYEYERIGIYDTTTSSTSFYRLDSNLFIVGFSVLF